MINISFLSNSAGSDLLDQLQSLGCQMRLITNNTVNTDGPKET